jgi:hypothetical protein
VQLGQEPGEEELLRLELAGQLGPELLEMLI